MKFTVIIKFLLLLSFGALFGVSVHADYEKWHSVGRDAFLAYETRRFDRYMLNPGTGALSIFTFAILALGLGAFYEGIALLITKLVSIIRRGKVPDPGNS